MLSRHYDPIDGKVTIDGQNLKDLTFESFRKHISVIP
jgi:ABC-type multidrug transport system fused ATPase/permease subunit